jgi:hypothetical protein
MEMKVRQHCGLINNKTAAFGYLTLNVLLWFDEIDLALGQVNCLHRKLCRSAACYAIFDFKRCGLIRGEIGCEEQEYTSARARLRKPLTSISIFGINYRA